MSLRLGAGLVCVASIFAAQEGSSAADIASLVRESVAKHDKDGSLARELHKLRPSEQLADYVVEELESLGAGPRSVAELERLRDLSRGLADPARAVEFPHDPFPSIPEQHKLVADTQHIALEYARSLPDFLCTESIRRFNNLRGNMTLVDTLEVRLSYRDGRENYQLLRVNGRMSTRRFEEIGGALSEGEFGSLLYAIFHGDSHTRLRWDHWTTLRKRPAHVFTFEIPREHSTYRMEYGGDARAFKQGVFAGQRGVVYVDRDTRKVLRIVREATEIPPDFPVRSSWTQLDYEFTAIAGREFLLPLRAEVRMGTDRIHTRNLVEFRDYRKFTGESTITFQEF